MKIRVLIADDEGRARTRVRRLLSAHEDMEVVGEAVDGEGVVQQVLALRPDLVLLDVQMPGMLGTEAAQKLAAYLPDGVRPAIVFTTAHAEHAVEAFGLASVDYVLKPIGKERLDESLRRVRQSLWRRSPTRPPSTPPSSTLTGHRGAALEAIPMRSIAAVVVQDGVAFAWTENQHHRLSESLAELEAKLPAEFVRVSRSAMVSTAHVSRVSPQSSGTFEVELNGGETVKVSRRRAKNLLERVGVDG